MTDIVERLRDSAIHGLVSSSDAIEAADEIERLLNLNEGLNYEYARLWDERKEAADEIERLLARVADLEDQLLQALGERPMRREGI